MRKVIKFLVLLIFIFSKQSNAYIIPEKEVREIETFDHEICLSKGTDLKDNYSKRMYWNCRLNQINNRISKSRKLDGSNKFYIAELKKIRRVINNLIEKIQSDINTQNHIHKNEYKLVLRKNDAYYYNLLHFFSYNYDIEEINNSSEIKYVKNLEEELKIIRKKELIKRSLEKFPECIRYDIGSKEFENCLDFKNKIEDCKKIAEEKITSRVMADRFDCKKKAYEKYPDHLALYNSEYEELKNRKVDEYNIDREKDLAIQKRLVELNKLMSGPRLSSLQLINLRKFEEKKCLMDKELENNMSKIVLIGECENAFRNINKNEKVKK